MANNVVLGDAQLFALGDLNQFVEQNLVLEVQIPVRLYFNATLHKILKAPYRFGQSFESRPFALSCKLSVCAALARY